MQLQPQEIGLRQSVDFRQFERPGAAVRQNIDGRLPRCFLLRVQSVNLRTDPHAFKRLIRAVDHGHGIIVVRILHVHWFAGLLRPEIAARGNQVIIVEMPDQRGPSIV